ncbi:NACHT, LRR and PYD domains-containing protein 3-like [Cetorhinus maximus]
MIPGAQMLQLIPQPFVQDMGSILDVHIRDLKSTITELVTNCDDYQLFQLTKFDGDSLQQVIEEEVEDHFSGQESCAEDSLQALKEKNCRWLLKLALKKWRSGVSQIGVNGINVCMQASNQQLSLLQDGMLLPSSPELSHNNLGDSGVKLLSDALRNPDCKIQKLELDDVGLTETCAEDLASALSANQSLTDLNLNDNKLGDSGLKLLSVALRNATCKIRKLKLDNVGVTDIKDLASALSTNRSLTYLNLNDNKLENSGVKLLSAALRNTTCKIRKLKLDNVGVTDIKDLASALSTNQSLISLNLNDNKLGDSGVNLLSTALRNQNCKIQKLGLYHNYFTYRCAKDLASALSTNRSLMNLNLNNNNLGDSGVKLLSAALRNPHCKIQKLGYVSD